MNTIQAVPNQPQPIRPEGIVYHELGHAILRMWNDPEWRSEDVADDFAIMMAMQDPNSGYTVTQDLRAYFQHNNPKQDIIGVIVGDPHPTGQQRVAHIESRLRDIGAWSQEWNVKMYPHMQAAWLQKIADTPQLWESKPLAQAELAKRGYAVFQ